MKIVITESQLRKITLNEVERKSDTQLYEDQYVSITSKNYDEEIKPNAYFNAIVQVSNISNEYITISVDTNVSNTQWGYNGEGPIEFTQKPIKPGGYANVIFGIDQSKDKVGGLHISPFNIIYATKGVQKTVKINYKWTSADKGKLFKFCKARFSDSQLYAATTWWKKWINNDVTKSKFAKIFKYDKNTVDKHFANYNTILGQLKLEYTSSGSASSAWVREGVLQKLGMSTGGYDIPITINCGSKDEGQSARATLIHEIQHILSSYHKFHPYTDNIFSFYGRMFKNMVKGESAQINDEEMKKFLISVGFRTNDLNYIIENYKWRLGNDQEHLSSPDELTSTLSEVRAVLKLTPEQQITKEMLIKNAKIDSVTVFISQWLFSKKSLDEYLRYNNSIAAGNGLNKTSNMA